MPHQSQLLDNGLEVSPSHLLLQQLQSEGYQITN
jgi:hypothetical protein